jgi:hypothetical protein
MVVHWGRRRRPSPSVRSTATLTGRGRGRDRDARSQPRLTAHDARSPVPTTPRRRPSQSPSIHPCVRAVHPLLATPPLTVAAGGIASHSHAPATVATGPAGLALSPEAAPCAMPCSRYYCTVPADGDDMRSAALGRGTLASIPARPVQDSPAAGCRAEPFFFCSVLSGYMAVGSWLYAVAGCIV